MTAATATAPAVTTGLVIDDEFRDLIVPPSPQERELLKASIAAQGCLEPLYVWKTAGRRILLDGHTRYNICAELGRSFQTRTVEVSSREEAKLWILEHQAGRRNLTDDQRAVIWNEIREQRSRVARASQLESARQTKSTPLTVSVILTDTGTPSGIPAKLKTDTRASVAKEARLPENKLRQAQVLKKHQPELYKKVLAGEITLRDTSGLTSGRRHTKRFAETDFYNRVGRTLVNLFKYNELSTKLKEIAGIKRGDWCPKSAEGVARLLKTFAEVQKELDAHVSALKAVQKKFAGVV